MSQYTMPSVPREFLALVQSVNDSEMHSIDISLTCSAHFSVLVAYAVVCGCSMSLPNFFTINGIGAYALA